MYAFRLATISSWHFLIRSQDPQENRDWQAWRRVTVDGHNVTDTPTDFSRTAEPIDVVLTSHVGAVSGTVVEGNDPSMAHGVVVVADDAQLLAYPSRFIRVGHVDAQCRFMLQGLLPGRYLALPLPDNQTHDIDVEWLDAMRRAASHWPCPREKPWTSLSE